MDTKLNGKMDSQNSPGEKNGHSKPTGAQDCKISLGENTDKTGIF